MKQSLIESEMNQSSVKQTSFIRFDTSQNVTLDKQASEMANHPVWRISGGFSYYVGDRKDEVWLRVPDGYRVFTRYLPCYLQRVLPLDSPQGKAYILYYFLQYGGLVKSKQGKYVLSVSEILSVIYDAMKTVGVPWSKRCVIYAKMALYHMLYL